MLSRDREPKYTYLLGYKSRIVISMGTRAFQTVFSLSDGDYALPDLFQKDLCMCKS